MKKERSSFLLLILFLVSGLSLTAQPLLTPLRSLGYSLIPAPQEVELVGGHVEIDGSWQIETGLPSDHIAVRRLVDASRSLHQLEFEGSGRGAISLSVQTGAIGELEDSEQAEQAYLLRIGRDEIEVVGNAAPGLFYGVQSLLQLIRRSPNGKFRLPKGTIRDWPRLKLRFIHWDTKHHQDRPETLRRFVDWAAFFKVNAIGFEIEDKYEYPSHPVVGAPGAFTQEEIRELTAYALERNIQLVPQIQSPAHMAYVLKHPEFHRLQADNSNYQACMCDDDAIRLMQDLYQDMIDATPGVEYFHVSTDEVYFAGICPKCQQSRPFSDRNRSLAWVEFVNTMHSWLRERSRKMLCWVEYPLLTEDLDSLPAGLINGVISGRSGDDWIQGLKRNGVPSLVYNSQQGAELLFPNYFSSDYLYRKRPVRGRLESPSSDIRGALEAGADVVGTYAAAWDDSGLHNELFWLGWATVNQYGWTPNGPSVDQSVADFMDVFYGPGNQDMVQVYRVLEDGARYYESALDQVPATRLKPTYGSWAGKGRDTTRIDLTLTPPALPFSYDENLITDDTFSRRYGRVLAQAWEIRGRIEWAIQTILGKISSGTRNDYNLEVLLSVAEFERHFTVMMLDLAEVERVLLQASEALSEERNKDAMSLLVRSHGIVRSILSRRSRVWVGLKQIWEKSRYPKGRSLDGRQFVHELDDLKDHRADRRPGLDYMLEPLENIGLEDWNNSLAQFIEGFAQSRGFQPPVL